MAIFFQLISSESLFALFLSLRNFANLSVLCDYIPVSLQIRKRLRPQSTPRRRKVAPRISQRLSREFRVQALARPCKRQAFVQVEWLILVQEIDASRANIAAPMVAASAPRAAARI